jgi:NADH-quinone oxidoreductase subunit M
MFDVYTVDATTLIVFPLVVALIVAILPLNRDGLGLVALAAQVLPFYWLLHDIIPDFPTDGSFAFETDKPWLPDIGVRYHVGIDGLSLVMICLTVLVLTCAIGYALWEGRYRGRFYFVLLLLLESALILVFCARDLILFYVGFEAMLIPFYFLMGIWGGEHRRRATLKFVIYTFVGTLLMLVGMIVIGLQAGSFDLTRVGTSSSGWLFASFAIAFAIKSPVWPLHGWLPDAYRSAPPEVAAVLSAVASKAGAYGFLRIVLPIFPGPVAEYQWVLITGAVIGLLYGSLLAFRQPDARGVIAYSSIGQMGLVTLGIFALNSQGVTGAAFQMVNHGLLSAALFLLAGWVAHTTGSDEFRHLGGMARGRPILATTVIIVGVATLAVPGSNAFASEFLVLLGAFQTKAALGVIASLAVVLAAMYMLRWISAVLHDREGDAVGASNPPELRDGGFYAVIPLVAAVLALSFYPNAVTKRVDDTTAKLTTPAATEAAK